MAVLIHLKGGHEAGDKAAFASVDTQRRRHLAANDARAKIEGILLDPLNSHRAGHFSIQNAWLVAIYVGRDLNLFPLCVGYFK